MLYDVLVISIGRLPGWASLTHKSPFDSREVSLAGCRAMKHKSDLI